MKTNLRKSFYTIIASALTIPTLILPVQAKTPSFNNAEAQSAAQGFLEPLTTFAMWSIPLVAGLMMVVAAVMWMTKDEDEKEQKPYMKTGKKILVVAIIAEFVPVILRVLGIS